MVEAMRNGHTIIAACQLLDVSRTVEWEARKEDKEYCKAMDEAREARDELVEDALYANCLAGDVSAQKTWLFNRASPRWKANPGLVIGGDGDGEGVGAILVPIKEVVVNIPSGKTGTEQSVDE